MTGLFSVWNVADNTNVFYVNERGDTVITGDLTVDGNYIGNGSLLTNLPTGGNLSWNQSLADTLYAGIEWDYNQTTATYNLYDTRWTATYNATYNSKVSFPGWTNVAWQNQSNSFLANNFTANQNMTNNNITGMDCVIFTSGGKICSGV